MRRSPLHLASEKGHVRAVRFLLSLRADPNVADVAGARPYTTPPPPTATVARYLPSPRARTRPRARARGAAVHWAAATGAVRVASILLAHDPRVWAATTEPGGWTPLHLGGSTAAPSAERLLNLLPDEASRRAALERVPATGRTPAACPSPRSASWRPSSPPAINARVPTTTTRRRRWRIQNDAARASPKPPTAHHRASRRPRFTRPRPPPRNLRPNRPPAAPRRGARSTEEEGP